MDIFKIYSTLKHDLDLVKNKIDTILQNQKTDETKDVIDYILKTKGKLIRPVLVYPSTYIIKPKLTQEEYEKLLLCATAIELVHMASLIHDDIIDDADIRRNIPSVKSKFDNQVSVTIGVYLYSIALQLMAQAESINMITELSITVQKMCEGEILQYNSRKQQNTNLDHYYNALEAKTATLFRTSCLVGSTLFNFDQKTEQALSNYATELGYLFQLTDDYLDMFGTESDLNKKVGQDFFQGQFTLPMILAFNKMNQTEQKDILNSIKNNDLAGFEFMKNYILNSTIQKDIMSSINSYYEKSKKHIQTLPNNQFSQSLTYLSDYILDRINKNT